MKHWPLIATVLLLAAPPAGAQNAGTPVMGSPATAQETGPASAEKQVRQILVLGDALGGGLAAGLDRVAEVDGNYEVSVRFNEESGLARPEVYDWPATVPKILKSNSYDVIVVMLGANDRQIIRAGGNRYPFNSEGWASAYKANLDVFLDELAASGARVVWVSPPPMKDPEYDAAVAVISTLQRESVEARGMRFVDMRAELAAPGGGYTDTGADETGTVTRLRARDGIAFYKAGNNRMGQIVLAALESGEKTQPAAVSEDQNGRGDMQGPREQLRQVPIFGQVTMDGSSYTVQPEGVTANAVVLAGAGLSSAAAMKTLREIAPQGSGAQDLFTRGMAPVAPAGRPDDFALPPAEKAQ